MNDRFKFRVWDKINSKWVKGCLLDIESGYILGYYDNQQAYKRRYAIMQSTGLKDKNGKLIFEGDILKINEISRLVIVRFKGISFELYAEPTNIPGYHNDKYIPKDCEIVGNVYENKELLNA